MTLEAMTPPQIDAQLNEWGYQQAVAAARAESYREAARHAAEGGRWLDPNPQRAAQLEAAAQAEQDKADELEAKMAPLHAEFDRRGGWTRAFLVTNTGGHVHRSMDCPTCFTSTRYAWMTEFSGMDEAEIVDAAGERACTVCYPSAPVEVLSKPTRMFTPAEREAQARRAERDAKRAAKEAAKVLDPATGEVLFNTERAALNAISANTYDLLSYDNDHPSAEEWKRNAVRAAEALAAKTGQDARQLLADARVKAARKYLREHKDWETNHIVVQMRARGMQVDEPKYLGLKPAQIADIIAGWM